MIELGRRWCAALGVATDTDTAPHPVPHPAPGQNTGPNGAGAAAPAGVGAPPPAAGSPPVPGATPLDESGADESGQDRADGPPPEESEESGEPERSALAQSITGVTSAVAAAVAAAPPPVAPPRVRVVPASEAAEEAARERAGNAAARVFGPGRGGRRTTTGSRAPEPEERSASRVLGRALDTAGVRDRVATRTTSAVPPGRLRMRGALARDAQRAAGATPTAEPFVRTVRRTVPAPPLRLGIACDVSGSMEDYADAVASAAWILAHAVDHARLPSSATATVIFGHAVRAITRPGVIPTQVTTFDCDSMYHDFPGAVDALDGARDLSRPGAARLLVVVTDGIYEPASVIDGDARVARLRASGCGVLQLSPPDPDRRTVPGATEHLLTNPTTTATAIGRAATAAIRAAARGTRGRPTASTRPAGHCPVRLKLADHGPPNLRCDR